MIYWFIARWFIAWLLDDSLTCAFAAMIFSAASGKSMMTFSSLMSSRVSSSSFNASLYNRRVIYPLKSLCCCCTTQLLLGQIWTTTHCLRRSYNCRTLLIRGGFRISSKGEAEISSGGGENLPGGGEKKNIFFILFLVRILYFIRKFCSPQRSRFRGVETPLNDQGVASPTPETLRGWRDGPRHLPEIASAPNIQLIDF